MAPRWNPYVPVAKRRAAAARKMKQMEKQGLEIEPLAIHGRKIAHTFWGEAWCHHLERFSDYANRLPRGRTYARNGSICHLAIRRGHIQAIVSGSTLYDVDIRIQPLPEARWERLREQCAGHIGSLLELLQGKLSEQVMAIVTDRDHGLFPQPGEIEMSCTCPDWAGLCKHRAAVLYGVGARLDQRPEMLFELRGVDHEELITVDLDLTGPAAGRHRRLEEEDLSSLFGVEIDDREPSPPAAPRRSATSRRPPTRSANPAATGRDPARTTKGGNGDPVEEVFVPTGEAIARLRQRLGLNKAELARQVGASLQTISNWENRPGRLNLQRRHLEALRRLAKERR
ncbi:helix-turn-helix domain-containing protein [Endothiovibrio diazotrophicus]